MSTCPVFHVLFPPLLWTRTLTLHYIRHKNCVSLIEQRFQTENVVYKQRYYVQSSLITVQTVLYIESIDNAECVQNQFFPLSFSSPDILLRNQ
jgi:hypothetical protein